MFKVYLIAAILFFRAQSFATGGSTVGNGGDVVVCVNSLNEIVSVDLLDLVENEVLRGQKPIPKSGTDPLKLVQEYLHENLSPIDPTRAHFYRINIEKLFNETLFLKGTHFTDVPDSDHGFLPENCHIEQIAIQSNNPFSPPLMINQDLWEKLDAWEQAALLIHEITYQESIRGGATNSIAVRYFVSNLISGNLLKMRLQDYVKLAVYLKFEWVNILGFQASLENAQGKGRLEEGYKPSLIIWESHIENLMLATDSIIVVEKQQVYLSAQSAIHFNRPSLQVFVIRSEVPFSMFIPEAKATLDIVQWQRTLNGEVKFISKNPFSTLVDGIPVVCAPEEEITLNSAGLKNCTLTKSFWFKKGNLFLHFQGADKSRPAILHIDAGKMSWLQGLFWTDYSTFGYFQAPLGRITFSSCQGTENENRCLSEMTPPFPLNRALIESYPRKYENSYAYDTAINFRMMRIYGTGKVFLENGIWVDAAEFTFDLDGHLRQFRAVQDFTGKTKDGEPLQIELGEIVRINQEGFIQKGAGAE
jgi:hypothetical protein